MTKSQLQTQVRELRKLVRAMLPAFEAEAGVFPPEVMQQRRDDATNIRRYLRYTTPARQKKNPTY